MKTIHTLLMLCFCGSIALTSCSKSKPTTPIQPSGPDTAKFTLAEFDTAYVNNQWVASKTLTSCVYNSISAFVSFSLTNGHGAYIYTNMCTPNNQSFIGSWTNTGGNLIIIDNEGNQTDNGTVTATTTGFNLVETSAGKPYRSVFVEVKK